MGDICINIHIQCTFADTSVCFCYACHLPSQHIKESTKGGGCRRRPPPFVEAAEGRLPCLLPPRRSCLATTDILCCHSAPLVWPHKPVPAGSGSSRFWFLRPEPTPRFSRFGSYPVRFRRFRFDSAASCLRNSTESERSLITYAQL